MKAKQTFFYSLFLISQLIVSQTKEPISLQEVVITDVALRNYSSSLQIKKIADSVGS
ncbi:hypothetical protein [Flavobacterium ovatum]|uniref:hypothetical protein n=1 Tax=Flavobacterium ovatum TaxID=1928857 RepID=UPI00344CEEAF